MSTFFDITPKPHLSSSELGNDHSFEHDTSHISEIDDNLLRHLEGEIFRLQNEVRTKNIEIEILAEELCKSFENISQTYQIEAVLYEYENMIKDVCQQLADVKKEADLEKNEKEKYKMTLASLENMIEGLNEENKRLNNETHDLVAENTRLYKLIQEREQNQQEELDLSCFSFSHMKNTIQEKVLNVSLIDFEENLSTHESELTQFTKPNGHYGMRDKVLITKLELLMGKLTNEERKNKELEFMISAQKKVLESSNEIVSSLKSENKGLKDQVDELGQTVEDLKEERMKDKAKLDQITSFYQMMQNSKVNKDQDPLPMERLLNLKEEHKADTTQEIKNIKSELQNLTQFLQQSMMNNRTENIPYHNRHEQDSFNNIKPSSFGLNQVTSSSMRPPRSSFYLTKAVQNSNSLWCNIKANIGSLQKTNEN